MAGRPKKQAAAPLPAERERLVTVVVLKNRGTAEHVRLCAKPARQSERVALVWAGDTITVDGILTGAALGELGDQWVAVETQNGAGYIHREYLVLPGDPPPDASE